MKRGRTTAKQSDAWPWRWRGCKLPLAVWCVVCLLLLSLSLALPASGQQAKPAFSWQYFNSRYWLTLNYPVPDIETATLQGIRFARQWCSTPGVLDQTCLTNAFSGGFEGTVFVDGGPYTISATVTVPSGVHLVGGWRFPGGPSYHISNPYSLSPLFLITVGSGSTSTPAFIMHAYSGMEGIALFWPNQSTSSPVQYGWAITSSGSAANDRVVLRDLFLINPYLGIYQNYGGQWEIDNVYGEPLSVGLKMDQVYDGTEVHDVHWWTFWTGPGDGTQTWLQQNGTGFLLDRVDGVNISQVEVYGYHRGFDFEDAGNGAAWANLSNFLIDSATDGIHIGAAGNIAIANGTISSSSNAGYLWAITTGSAVGLHGNVAVANVLVYAEYGGADITSSNGNFTFSNFVGRAGSDNEIQITGTGDLVGPLVVNESTANVEIEGNHANQKALVGSIMGGSSTYIGRVAFPGTSTEVSPAGFSTPSGWQANTYVTSITGGSEFALNTGAGVSNQSFALGTNLNPGLYTLSFTFRATGAAGSSAQFYFRLWDNTNTYWQWPYSGFSVEDAPSGQAINVTVPLYIPAQNLTLQWVFGNGSGTVDITNLKISSVSSGTDTLGLLSLLYGSRYYIDPTGNGRPALARSASLTTTAAASDVVALPGVSAGSNCTASPTNSAAAGFAGVYLVPGAGQVTVNHPATAGGTFAVVCAVTQ